MATRSSWSRSSSDPAAGRLGTPTSARHRPPQAGEIASRRPKSSAGTAGNADLRSAPPAAGGRNRVAPTETKRGNGWERRRPVGTARRRRAKSRLADRDQARERLGTPTSDRHRPPQAGEIASRRPRRSAGTAWNADLRSAPPAAGGRNRVSPTEIKRGNGLERRPPVGTAARQGCEGRFVHRLLGRGCDEYLDFLLGDGGVVRFETSPHQPAEAAFEGPIGKTGVLRDREFRRDLPPARSRQ